MVELLEGHHEGVRDFQLARVCSLRCRAKELAQATVLEEKIEQDGPARSNMRRSWSNSSGFKRSEPTGRAPSLSWWCQSGSSSAPGWGRGTGRGTCS